MGTQTGTCSVHTWNDGLNTDEGEPKMGQRVTATLMPEPPARHISYSSRSRTRLSESPDDDDDDEDDDDYTDDD